MANDKRMLPVPETTEQLVAGFKAGIIKPSKDGKTLIDPDGKVVATLITPTDGDPFFIDINVVVPERCQVGCCGVTVCTPKGCICQAPCC